MQWTCPPCQAQQSRRNVAAALPATALQGNDGDGSVSTPSASVVAAASQGPMPVPSAFGQTNVYTFGSPPPNVQRNVSGL
jgi:hypothetical protein